MVFGKRRKVEFNATREPNRNTQDLFENPQNYSFIHNYKVHYKRGALQMLANKVDVSVNSSQPELPENQLVVDEFHRRMSMSLPLSDTRARYSNASFHITDVEYKESIAIPQPYSSPKISLTSTTQSYALADRPTVQEQEGSAVCANCGSDLPSDSKFCNRCGTQIVA